MHIEGQWNEGLIRDPDHPIGCVTRHSSGFSKTTGKNGVQAFVYGKSLSIECSIKDR